MTDPSLTPHAGEPVMVRYRGRTFPMPPGTHLHAAIRACALHPELTAAVVNGVVVRDDVPLAAGDRVTLVPMMSGG